MITIIKLLDIIDILKKHSANPNSYNSINNCISYYLGELNISHNKLQPSKAFFDNIHGIFNHISTLSRYQDREFIDQECLTDEEKFKIKRRIRKLRKSPLMKDEYLQRYITYKLPGYSKEILK